MARVRTGSVFTRDNKVYARVTYVGEDGKRKAMWRRARNRTHARQLLPELIKLSAEKMELPDIIGSPVNRSRRGFIYAMEMRIPGIEKLPIKIGISMNVQTRLDTLLTGSPYPVAVLGFWESVNAAKDERSIHQQFAESRMRGEWFSPSVELTELIRERTAAYRIKLGERSDELAALIAAA